MTKTVSVVNGIKYFKTEEPEMTKVVKNIIFTLKFFTDKASGGEDATFLKTYTLVRKT